jgi:tRNA A37 threonylcarbamoyladenosine dehydratase
MQDNNKSETIFQRTEMLIGGEAIAKLRASRVAVFGVGGVGGYVVEVLARSGVGSIDIFDNDRVSITNINRQIIALHSTLSRLKVDVARERILDINPDCIVTTHPVFYLPEDTHVSDLPNISGFVDLSVYDYVVDCIDTVTAKIDLARRCYEMGIASISSMGAANKMDATAFRVTDLFKTSVDPLAKIMRKKLRSMGVDRLKVVYSEEIPAIKTTIPSSNAFVPAACGIVVGSEVVKDLISR